MRVLVLLVVTMLSLLPGAVSAQMLSGPQIRTFLSDVTLYAQTASGSTWNAYFSQSGEAVYWGSSGSITHGVWRIAGSSVCVRLHGFSESCRNVEAASDGLYLWREPGSTTPTRIIRRDAGDVLRLTSSPHGSTLTIEERQLGPLASIRAQGYRFIQVASVRSVQEAAQYVEALRNLGAEYPNAFLTRSGWYAIVLGYFPRHMENQVEADLVRLRSAGVIPNDTFIAVGFSYLFAAYDPNANGFVTFEPPSDPFESDRVEAVSPPSAVASSQPPACRNRSSFCTRLGLLAAGCGFITEFGFEAITGIDPTIGGSAGIGAACTALSAEVDGLDIGIGELAASAVSSAATYSALESLQDGDLEGVVFGALLGLGAAHIGAGLCEERLARACR